MQLLKISRSSIYYTPVGFDQATIELMHEIDRVFTKYPFFGSRQIAAYLLQSGFSAGRHRVRRLMGIMGLQAIHCRAVNGWPRSLSRQHLHRTALAIPQAGSRLLARDYRWLPSQSRHRQLDRLLQQRAASHRARQTDAERGILRPSEDTKSGMNINQMRLSKAA